MRYLPFDDVFENDSFNLTIYGTVNASLKHIIAHQYLQSAKPSVCKCVCWRWLIDKKSRSQSSQSIQLRCSITTSFQYITVVELIMLILWIVKGARSAQKFRIEKSRVVSKKQFVFKKKEIGFARTSVRLLDEPTKTFAALFPHHVNLSLLIYVGLTTSYIL